MDIIEIIATVVTIGSGLLGAKFWQKFKKILNAFKEISDVFVAIEKASADKTWTKEEIRNIRLQINEALAAAGLKHRV